MRAYSVGLVCTLAAGAFLAPARAQEPGIAFFEKKIRPLFVAHCYECHAAGAKKIRGGFRLDSRESLREGGDSGRVIEPGQPDKSLLIQAVRFTQEGLKMPPRGKLPAAAIADLEAWVKMGAPDPRTKATAATVASSWEEILRTRRDWWSLRPVQRPPAPRLKNMAWSANPIDQFLLAKLEASGLTPAAAADPQTLVRRLSLVLTGLPPTPFQVDAFVRACGAIAPGEQLPPAAVAQLVDSLLASPHFGEHWARHWMDVVRFSETHGNEWNYEVHHAWRYRDYLIRAFNADVAFDQLVREHLAGDLLPEPRWNHREDFNESVIGTAFYRFGEVNHDDCISLRQIGYDLVDNQLDTLTKAFQGLTVACARCHDHKLDAVSMRDYYGLLGVLRSARQVSHTIDGPTVNATLLAKMRDRKHAIRRELADTWRREIPGVLQTLLVAASGRPGTTTPAAAQDAALLAKWRAVLDDHKPALENPLTPWTLLVAAQQQGKLSFTQAWKKVTARLMAEDASRRTFNQDNFTTLADFRQGSWPDWQVGGQGLRGTPARSADFVVAAAGQGAVAAVLPPGCYTHGLSDKLNGTLRSPVLTTPRKWISFNVLGQHRSAVRLVSNNCQLNYKNYRALRSSTPQWITFPLPDDRASLRVYAELMTMFDNPKFPDQLGKLGGDNMDDRIPWEQAAANPRSFFGVTQVVVHDQPSPPKAELLYLSSVLPAPPVTTPAELAALYAGRLDRAIQAWKDDRATEEDALLLDAFLQKGLLSNRTSLTPRLAALVAEYRALDARLSLPRVVPGVADCGAGFDQPLFIRGDCLRPGDPVPRRYVEVLGAEPIKSAGSGRLELAEAIASRHNPLTARVFVNRVWHHLFGTGLVRTVDDFGHVGEMPSHPELLDSLAARFVDEGWSVKRLLRAIVLTRTFQMGHRPNAASRETDPENRLLQHYPARRMEAETIRDTILATSGRLDPTLFGMSIPSYRDKENAYRRLFRGPLDGRGRRSIYIKFTLMEAPRFLSAFNLPGGKVAQGRRDVTEVPAQALAMLNDPFVLDQAEVWSRQLVQRSKDTVSERIAAMFRIALGREATSAEHERFTQFVSQVATIHHVGADAVLSRREVWRDVAHTVFNCQEFITIP